VNPFLFIVGCPRSGTTLLRRVLDAHPDIAITRETHWITDLLRGDDAVSPNEPVTHELLSRLRGEKRFTRLGVDQARLEGLLSRTQPVYYAEFVRTVLDLYGEAQGKRLVGDKVPGYVRDISVLHALWPAARFVHLIRDGRDVCTSVLNWDRENRAVTRMPGWDDDPVSTTALWWEQLVRIGRDAGSALPSELYYELRYEALVARPEAECRALCAFLGVPYDGRMLRFHESRTRADPGLSAKKAWLPITAGLRSWRSDMTAGDLERFEAVAGALLDELDYPRAATA
jgi:Sulfotransferase family